MIGRTTALTIQTPEGVAFTIPIASPISRCLALAVDFASRREGTTLGFVFALMDGVGALGAVLAGYVGEVNLGNAFLLAAVLALITVTLALLVPLDRRRATPATG